MTKGKKHNKQSSHAERVAEEFDSGKVQPGEKNYVVGSVTTDFYFDTSQNGWWDLKQNAFHKDGRSIDAKVPRTDWPRIKSKKEDKLKKPMRPSDWLQINENRRIVTGSTWAPGKEKLIKGFAVVDGDLVRNDARGLTYNSYIQPNFEQFKGGKPAGAQRWVQHVRDLWPAEADYFFDWCAHLIQRTEEKCNIAIVMAGAQGIGKDTALNPLRDFVGFNNYKDIDPDNLFDKYNTWVKSLLIIIGEWRPTSEDIHATTIYNKLKPLCTIPPEYRQVSDKYISAYWVKNVARIAITTNHPESIYLPEDDRRLYVMTSAKKKDWQTQAYFKTMGDWLRNEGGNADVFAWLKKRDISKFEPLASPEHTAGWTTIAAGWNASLDENDAVSVALDKLNRPNVFWMTELLRASEAGMEPSHTDDIRNMLKGRKIIFRMSLEGYSLRKLDVRHEYPYKNKDGTPVKNSEGKLVSPFKCRHGFWRTDKGYSIKQVDALLDKRARMITQEGITVLNNVELTGDETKKLKSGDK